MIDVTEKTVLNGIGLMIIATVLFSIMHASIKFMSTSMHPFEIAFFRNLFGLLVIAPWFIKYGFNPLKTKKIKLHVARSLFNVIAMMSFFYSLSIAPLADVASLAFTAPLFASILAVIFLKEIVGIKRGIAIAFGFIGALIVVDPIYSSINNGHLLVLLSASVWSVSLIIIKIVYFNNFQNFHIPVILPISRTKKHLKIDFFTHLQNFLLSFQREYIKNRIKIH